MSNTMTWVDPAKAIIEEDAMYLVKTNGAEWRDADLFMRPGWAIPSMMGENVVRGRPLAIALITEPEV